MTTTLEISRKLKEAGFRQNNSYFVYLPDAVDCERLWSYQDLVKISYLKGRELLSSPTTDELLAELPECLNNCYYLTIEKRLKELWKVSYYYNEERSIFKNSQDELADIYFGSLPDCLAEMWLFLKKKGLIE